MREQILAYRKKHKLSQTQFCKLCNISRFLLYNIESGRIDKPKRMQQLGRLEEILAADSASKGE